MSLHHPDPVDRRTDFTGHRIEGPIDVSVDDDGWETNTWRLTVDKPDDETGLQMHKPAGPERTCLGRIKTTTLTTTEPAWVETKLQPLFLGGLTRLDPARGTGLTEILVTEIDPAIHRQGWGPRLVTAALADVPDTELVILEPKATPYSNIEYEDCEAAVDRFWRSLGFDDLPELSGYLAAPAGRVIRKP